MHRMMPELGFTALQSQANTLVEKGKLIEAMPLLKELVKRVEASDNSEIKLDFLYSYWNWSHPAIYSFETDE